MLRNLASSGPIERRGPRRIVVVDDDPVLRAILRGYLEDAGYRVTEAADGENLIDALPRLAPALVLLDVKLPGTDGFELLRSIRARSSLPGIMVTSRSEARARVEGLGLGAGRLLAEFPRRRLFCAPRRRLRGRQIELEPEAATAFRAPSRTDFAAHARNQRPRNGEAEPGTPAPVRGVGMDLRERLEQLGECSLVDTDSVDGGVASFQ